MTKTNLPQVQIIGMNAIKIDFAHDQVTRGSRNYVQSGFRSRASPAQANFIPCIDKSASRDHLFHSPGAGLREPHEKRQAVLIDNPCLLTLLVLHIFLVVLVYIVARLLAREIGLEVGWSQTQSMICGLCYIMVM